MNNNVLIFGAGFSADAGIPMLGKFADIMWDIAARNSVSGVQLSEGDRLIFEKAAAVRTLLDGYHGRANFDERNIEDILSILAIGAYANDNEAAAQLADFRRAIARTIELTCQVKHPGLPINGMVEHLSSGITGYYLDFWRAMFRCARLFGKMPTILTFNYDLVLERSLFHFLNGKHAGQDRHELFPCKRVRLNYHYGALSCAQFEIFNCDFGYSAEPAPGTGIRQISPDAIGEAIEIEILKLHGSVNFPVEPKNGLTNLIEAIDDPNILPPIFNRMSNSTHARIWDVALRRIRVARNLVVVGYSMPQTDIYMQYFLKAGLGPNRNFDDLTVYDPILFTKTETNDAMRRRYADCFAQQMRKRIEFNPLGTGSTYDFIHTLANDPHRILF